MSDPVDRAREILDAQLVDAFWGDVEPDEDSVDEWDEATEGFDSERHQRLEAARPLQPHERY